MQLIISLQQLYPVVTMHGIGDDAQSMNDFVKWTKEAIPGLYIKNCEVDRGKISTFLLSLKNQINHLADCINGDPMLKNGFIGVGYSNGGVLMRGYLQMYNHQKFKMVRYVGLSAPNGGFFCGRGSKCVFIRLPFVLNQLMNGLAYTSFAQKRIGPAAYWRDPTATERFRQTTLLAELDNLNHFNAQYKRNFMSVDKMILYGSDKDGTISPWNSAWFGTWGASDRVMLSMEQRPDYNADNFGLKSMRQQGRIVTINSHLKHFDLVRTESFTKTEMPKWLKMNKK